MQRLHVWAFLLVAVAGRSSSRVMGTQAIPEDIVLNAVHEDTLTNGHSYSYRVWLPPDFPDAKVVLLPLSGSAALVVTFDPNANASEAMASTMIGTGTGGSVVWTLAKGVEEVLIRRERFCHPHAGRRGAAAVQAADARNGCYLYLRVFSLGDEDNNVFKLGVLQAHDPSVCERTCPLSFASISGAGDCEALPDCSCEGVACVPSETTAEALNGTSGGDPCHGERNTCASMRLRRERLQLVVWISLAGTSIFVLLIVVHAYRLTSPVEHPPQVFGGKHALTGYSSVVQMTPLNDHACPTTGRAERHHQRARQDELEEAEHAVLFE
jgi:hypothetical protein